MKPIDRNSLEEQTRLVSRYVAGDLSRSERADFEAWMIASPELAGEVEMERRLRRGIASADRRGWLKRRTPAPSASHGRRWQMAIAASVLATMGLAVTLSLTGKVSEDESGAPVARSEKPAQPFVASLGRFRGDSSTPDIHLSMAAPPSALIVEPDVVTLTCENGAVELECANGGEPTLPQFAEYEMDLIKLKGETLQWRSQTQAPVAARLSFNFRNVNELQIGDYEVVIRGVSPEHNEVVGRYLLRVE